MAVEIKRRGEIDGVEQLTRYLDLLNRDTLLAPGQRGLRRPADQAAGAHPGRRSRNPLCDIGLRRDARHGQRRVPAVLTRPRLVPMARRRTPPRRQRSPPPLPLGAGSRPGPTATTTRCGRSPAARATKTYRCPGCDHEISPAQPHVVVWPADRGEHARRRPAALAHAVLGESGNARPDAKVVLGASSVVESAAGSTSSTSTPPASLGWMKLIREFAVPRRGAS